MALVATFSSHAEEAASFICSTEPIHDANFVVRDVFEIKSTSQEGVFNLLHEHSTYNRDFWIVERMRVDNIPCYGVRSVMNCQISETETPLTLMTEVGEYHDDPRTLLSTYYPKSRRSEYIVRANIGMKSNESSIIDYENRTSYQLRGTLKLANTREVSLSHNFKNCKEVNGVLILAQLPGTEAATAVMKAIPYAKPYSQHPGWVYSPYGDNNVLDVTDMKPGSKVKDPYNSKVFLVPKPVP